MRVVIYFTLILSLFGCASHEMMRGNVAMKLNKKSAHICLGDNEVKVGDKINFYNSQCADYDNTKSGLAGLCKFILLGSGTVEKTLNTHYSLVSTDGTFEFKEGSMVEKAKKSP